MADDPDADVDSCELSGTSTNTLAALANHVLDSADQLPEDDPKFDSIKTIIEEKQKFENNKIIIFSTFRHTLGYINAKLRALGYRVTQIDGSVKDDDRRDLRERFELPKNDENAIC